jgi:hypothetical protein
MCRHRTDRRALESGQDTYVDAYVDENDLNLAAFAVPAPGTFL